MEVDVKYVVPLMKSPNPKGRVGPKKWQDWYRSCLKATRIAQDGDVILVVSQFVETDFDEVRHYASMLRVHCGSRISVRVLREGFETCGQIDAAALRIASKPCVVVCSLPHWPRVWWLTHLKPNWTRKIVIGIPRPRELVTDLVFIVVFPIIDMFGGREWWLRRANQRREKGKL